MAKVDVTRRRAREPSSLSCGRMRLTPGSLAKATQRSASSASPSRERTAGSSVLLPVVLTVEISNVDQRYGAKGEAHKREHASIGFLWTSPHRLEHSEPLLQVLGPRPHHLPPRDVDAPAVEAFETVLQGRAVIGLQ